MSSGQQLFLTLGALGFGGFESQKFYSMVVRPNHVYTHLVCCVYLGDLPVHIHSAN